MHSTYSTFTTHLPSPPYVKLPSLSSWDTRKAPPMMDDLQLPPIHLALSPLDTCSESSQDSPFPSPQQEVALSFTSRKGSIASLLNSDPELRMLDEEELRSGFQSHFNDGLLKRGRPPRPQQHPQQQQPMQPQLVPEHAAKRRRVKKSMATHNAIVTATSPTDPTTRTKGLRHFSKQVCDKVKSRGVTTYNEVADELAMDIRAQQLQDKHAYDQKNIRRRVYDALNVLMAIDVIAKDKKEIKWLGIPSCYQAPTHGLGNEEHHDEEDDVDDNDNDNDVLMQIYEEERRQSELISSVERTRGQIHDNISKYVHLRQLIQRNKLEHQQKPHSEKAFMPFSLVMASNADTPVAQDGCPFVVDAESNRHHRTIHDDFEVLSHLEFTQIPAHQLATWLPDPTWQAYLPVNAADEIYAHAHR